MFPRADLCKICHEVRQRSTFSKNVKKKVKKEVRNKAHAMKELHQRIVDMVNIFN